MNTEKTKPTKNFMTHPEFVFKPIDFEGWQTLEAIASAPLFNAWMYETISPRMNGKILEIGSGIGNISNFFLQEGKQIMLSDIRESYCRYLVSKFGHLSPCLGVRQIDLVHPNFALEYADLLSTFDSVFALNVVEHIENDNLAIANAQKLLKSGGRLVILVPAYQWLYNEFDKSLAHYRRYSKRSLSTLFLKNNFYIEKKYHFNFAAMGGWWFSGSVLRKKIIPSGQMKIYNALVPVFKWVDKLVVGRIGISVIVEGIKK